MELHKEIKAQLEQKGYLVFLLDYKNIDTKKFYKSLFKLKNIWHHVVKEIYFDDELVMQVLIVGFTTINKEFYTDENIEKALKEYLKEYQNIEHSINLNTNATQKDNNGII